MMVIHLCVALRIYCQIELPVLGKKVEHMCHKWDRRFQLGLSFSINFEG
ncbi:Uncharacterised protein [Mycobacteroides abscessus subsp. abscessus]|nr:Uncharacterised protein [Mycobacteroides abscessus subsp. abscessus]